MNQTLLFFMLPHLFLLIISSSAVPARDLKANNCLNLAGLFRQSRDSVGTSSKLPIGIDQIHCSVSDDIKTIAPLHTSGSTIVTHHGSLMNLRCIDWPGHMDAMIPEGLQYQNVHYIAKIIKNGLFNCVRLNYAVQMIDEEKGGVLVSDSFKNISLTPVFHQAVKKNPWLAKATRIEAFDAVIAVLGHMGIMVILDNTVSKAEWCCSNTDGNGFFGDQFFNVDNWRKSLRFMAQRYIHQKNVVAMSLRNELRNEPTNAEQLWFQHTSSISLQLHIINPDILIIVSGLSFDTRLDMLNNPKFAFPSLDNKLVFEIHWYAWFDSNWQNGCAASHARMDAQVKTLLDPTSLTKAPVFLSEFGLNVQKYGSEDSSSVNHIYVNCVRDWVTKNKVGWSLWELSGSHYLREGKADYGESFGYLTHNWSKLRSSSFNSFLASMP